MKPEKSQFLPSEGVKLENSASRTKKSPRFKFLGYTFDQCSGRASFSYQGIDGLRFTETVDFALKDPQDNLKNAEKISPAAQNSTQTASGGHASSQNPLLGVNSPYLDSALRLCFFLIGTSYYKTHPTREVDLGDYELSSVEAELLSHVYTDGLSQFAFENGLTRANLAHFYPSFDADRAPDFALVTPRSFCSAPTAAASADEPAVKPAHVPQKALVLQSGGKDSLLTATLLKENNLPFTPLYVTSGETFPEVIADFGAPIVIYRHLDRANLQKSAQNGALNGHVPITYIIEALALVQAILLGYTDIVTSIGQEGNEPHSVISLQEKLEKMPQTRERSSETAEKPIEVANSAAEIAKNSKNSVKNPEDSAKNHKTTPSGAEYPLEDFAPLPVNHEWSKTWSAENLLDNYISAEISPLFRVFSLLRPFSELKIAELFAKNCWEKYAHRFSSCNVANYGQGINNKKLTWCGKCAKCANSFLLFAPFVPPASLKSLFTGQDLFADPDLTEIFKGLLGVENRKKPFECVGETAELRLAYQKKLPGFADLPFIVPASDFDPNKLGPADLPPRYEEIIKNIISGHLSKNH